MTANSKKKNRIRREPLAVTVFAWAAIIVLALMVLLPIALLINTSLKTQVDFRSDPIGLFKFRSPSEIFAGYLSAFEEMQVLSKLLYTVVMTAGSAVIACIVVIMIAYPLSRNHFKGSGKVFTFVLASTFFPGSLIANRFMVKAVGLYNSPLVLLIFWGFGSLMVYIFMAIQFIKAIPQDLDEAAFMDGCGYFRYIFKFVIPLTKPILTTIFILKFVGAWNDFLTPYVYLVDDTYMTLATGLYNYKSTSGAADWPKLAAATTMVALPVVVLYGFLQKYIIEGMAAGALKG